MPTTLRLLMSTPSSIVGEQYSTGSLAWLNRSSRSWRLVGSTCAVCSRASRPTRPWAVFGVEPAEERVDAALGLVATDRVGCAVFACGGMPFDQAGLDPVAGAAVGLGDPGEDAGVGHRVQQCFDDGLGVGGLEGLIVQRETAGPAQPAPVGAQPGHIQVRRRSPARTWGARPGRRCPSKHRSPPRAPTAPSASPGWPA